MLVEDQLPHEMLSTGDHQRRGALFSRIYLHTGRLREAHEVIEVARRHDVVAHRGHVSALHGLICLRLGLDAGAVKLFGDALRFSESMTTKAPRFYEAYYARGLASAGLSLLHPHEREDRMRLAEQEYRFALKTCSEEGVVEDAAALFAKLRLPDIDAPRKWISALAQ